MAEQNAAVMKSINIDSSFAEKFKPVYKQIVTIVTNATDTTSEKQQLKQIVDNWYASADSSDLRMLGFRSANDMNDYVQELIADYSTPWFKYFIQFDPQQYLTKLKKVKVFALNGSRDIQVVCQQNLPAVRSALAAGETKTFDVKEMPGLNHLFQTCKKCTVVEYAQLEETIAPVVLQTITDWLNKNVK